MGISDDLINFWEKIMKSKMADGEHLKKWPTKKLVSVISYELSAAVRVSGEDLGNQWGDFFHIAHTHPSGGRELPFWGLGT